MQRTCDTQKKQKKTRREMLPYACQSIPTATHVATHVNHPLLDHLSNRTGCKGGVEIVDEVKEPEAPDGRLFKQDKL